MDYREKARRMLIEDEGLRLKAYQCPAGAWTIGVGHNLSARGVTGLRLLKYRTVGISHAQAMRWLDEDVAAAEADCSHLFGDALFDSWSDHRKLGFVNFLFNLGRDRALRFPNMLRHARNGHWSNVRVHLENSLWFRQVKTRGPKVVAMICDEAWPYG
jgi:GH24 family phage-related lysozyme (muramidase)